MAIDSDIYRKGVKGELTLEEIESLPREYAVFKQFFKHAIEIRN